MNNKATAILQFEEFLKSDNKGVLITGTNQYEKHRLVMAVINKHYSGANVLFRINALNNIENDEFLGWAGIKKQPKSGEKIRIKKNFYQFDSFNNIRTWSKTNYKADIAIIYPIDSLCREKNIKPLQNLYEHKEIKKIVLCSWTDRADYDYSIFNDFYTDRIIYDALEEDPEYHNRVIEHL